MYWSYINHQRKISLSKVRKYFYIKSIIVLLFVFIIQINTVEINFLGKMAFLK